MAAARILVFSASLLVALPRAASAHDFLISEEYKGVKGE